MRVIVASALLAAACGGDGTGPSPADAMTSSDAAVGVSTLTVTFDADPALPGIVRTGVTVTSATFLLRTLEVVGDAGSTATTRHDLRLDWTGETTPSSVVFNNPPPGLYSKVTLDIDGEPPAAGFELRGTAVINGTPEPFRIVDDKRLEVDVQVDVSLAPGGTATVPVRLDLRNALDLDFAALDVENGVYTLGPGDPGMSELREDLEDAFKSN